MRWQIKTSTTSTISATSATSAMTPHAFVGIIFPMRYPKPETHKEGIEPAMSDERPLNPLESSPTTTSSPPTTSPPPTAELADVGEDNALTGSKHDAPTDSKHEQTLWSGRTDWRHHFGSILLGGSVATAVWGVLIYLAMQDTITSWHAFLWGLLVALAISLFVGVRVAWRVMRRRYRLTEQRLFIEQGILSQTIDQTELIRVDDVRVHRKALDRLFRLGTVEIRSTDATDSKLIIEGIRDPEKIAEHLRDRMRALRNRSLFIENL